jgi:hypothetical protein
MPVVVDQVRESRPGEELVVGSRSGDGQAAVVFEDDGETAYFYACQTDNGPILDALHIYDVAAVTDRRRISEYELGWSPSGRQAILSIDGRPQAVFDFDGRRGWCRTGFPPGQLNNEGWSPDGHAWKDACLAPFR